MRVISLKEVIESTGLARSTIYKYIGEGDFPIPVSLGYRRVGWIDSEVRDWVLARIEQRIQASPVVVAILPQAHCKDTRYIMKLIRIKAVTELTSLARATIYKYMSESAFPKQVNLGANCVAWVESEVLAWVEEKIAQRDAQISEQNAA